MARCTNPWRQLAAAALLSMATLANAGVTVLHGFDYDDGEYPEGRLLIGADGRIYGSTYAGGSAHLGTVFAVDTAKVYQILHSFTGPDGNSLDSGLLQTADGTLFGTTPQGSISVGGNSTNFGGTVFSVAPDGSAFATLRSFSGNGLPDGAEPGALVDGGDGFFYGMTRMGGSGGVGTLFKISADGNLGTIYSFNAASGSYPDRQITLGSDGRLYGVVTRGPGSNPNGAIFSVDRSGGGFTLLHAFSGGDGNAPSGALLERGGAFYGVAGGGGANGGGTVFRMAADGSITTLYAFNGVDGGSPVGPLALGPDGNFYGLTFGGGSSGGGTIFRLTLQGALTTLHRLTGSDGTKPVVGPTMRSDGTLFGATTQYGGGSLATGSVFMFDPLDPQPAGLDMTKICYNEFDTCFPPINTTVGVPYSVLWSSENLSTCIASGAWSGRQPPGGMITVTPTKRGLFTYRLLCTGPGGTKSATVTVTVG